MRLRRPLLLAAAAVLAAACSDSTGPSSVVGVWNLQHIDGDALPVVTGESQLFYAGTGQVETTRITTQAMRLRVDERGADTVVVRVATQWIIAGDDPPAESFESALPLELRADTLCFYRPPSPFGGINMCQQFGRIRRLGDELVLSRPNAAGSVDRYVFRRAGG